MKDVKLHAAQEDVQLRISNCIIQIQAFEGMLKRSVAGRSLGGAIDALEMQLASMYA